jgi:hydrogenase 3 maturation protease
MSSIHQLLKEALEGAQTVAIIGCGSLLLGDDAAGTLIAQRLSDLAGNARAYCGGSAPENFTGEIKKFRPDVLLIIDAADMSLPPGAVKVIAPEEIKGVSFSTHMLPLSIMLDYLQKEAGCRVCMLGIQAVTLEFGSELSPEVKITVDQVERALRELLV